NLLPTAFLRQLIGLYGDSMQWLVPKYLEHVMAAFGRNQEQMRKSLQDAFGGMFPFGQFDEMGKQNLALFEQTMKMFTPPFAGGGAGPGASGSAGGGDKPAEKDKDAAMADLKERINALQHQIEQISKPKP
ncbi:MAG: PHB accumulation regulatory domain-containing protein, partial [Stellaceae bacterium]